MKHGLCKAHRKTYQVWCDMKMRCYNANCLNFKNYGARGIVVCELWLNSFENFFKDMGPKPDGLTIERNDVNGNYEPSNCRWASRLEQSWSRRDVVKLTIDGKTMPVEVWAREVGLNADTIRNRLRRGWDAERAVKAPPRSVHTK